MKELLHDDDVRAEGRAEGRKDGLSEGRTEGKAEALLMALGCKGEVPEALQSKILAEKDLALLNDWFMQALSCASVEEFAAALEEATGKWVKTDEFASACTI